MMSKSSILVKFTLYLYITIGTKNWDSDSFTNQEIGGVTLEAPRRRMHHAADVYGCILVVHGGFSTETKDILGDFSLYDLDKKTWIKCSLSPSPIQQTSSTLSKLPPIKLTNRYMHTMTAVYSHIIDDQSKYSRSLWDHPYLPKAQADRELLVYDTNLMGIYMFGGIA